MHPPRRGPRTGIAKVDREGHERSQAPPQGCEHAVVRQEFVKELFQIMLFWHYEAGFLHQGLEVFPRVAAATLRPSRRRELTS